MSVAAVELGARLAERRAELGWSLSELATRTGLSRAYLSALEHGRSKRPGAETVRRLESALGALRTDVESTVQAPPGLAALAEEQGLAQDDVIALSALRVRGLQPQSKERWAFIYQAMLASETMDSNVVYGNSPH